MNYPLNRAFHHLLRGVIQGLILSAFALAIAYPLAMIACALTTGCAY